MSVALQFCRRIVASDTDSPSRLAMTTACIQVTTVSGKTYMPSGFICGSVDALKTGLEEATRIPSREMRLVNGTTELPDDYFIPLGSVAKLTLVRREPMQALWLERARMRPFSLASSANTPRWVFEDHEIMLAAARLNPAILQHCGQILVESESFVAAAVEQCGLVLHFLPGRYHVRRDLMLKAIHSGYAYEALYDAHRSLRTDEALSLIHI